MAASHDEDSSSTTRTSRSTSSATPRAASHYFDELRWVIHIKSTLEEVVEEADKKTAVSVFSVPRALMNTKPESYVPQMFALGPYHHWDPGLYEMERYKLATVRNMQSQLLCQDIHQLVQYFLKKEHKIRSYYHRYLEFNSETLAWMMVMDVSFLLEFLRNYSDAEGMVFGKVPSMSHMVDSARMKLDYNSILRDVVMLENQIPLFLIHRILCFQFSSAQDADNELKKMLVGFLKEVCPFKVSEQVSLGRVKHYAHLLKVLYYYIVDRAPELCQAEQEQTAETLLPAEPAAGNAKGFGKSLSFGRNLFKTVWASASELRLWRVLVIRPFKFLLEGPWRIISQVPGLSIILTPLVKIIIGAGRSEDKKYEDSENKPPLVDEILIPSVSELMRAGVKFSTTPGDLRTIEFNPKTATIYIPAVCVDVNTEVVLRNLVAYETSVELGPMIFTRYTELINGIIDTEEDVKLLGENGIIENRMHSDEDVAKMWNGMSKSVRLSKVAFIDKTINDVNAYYNSRWRVKMRRFVQKYVFGSWQILTLLGAILLLLLTCVQAFCSVYSCGARLSGLFKSNEQ